MKVILLKDIKGVGSKFDVKDVSRGYVRNFLLPQKLVMPATQIAVQKFEKLEFFSPASKEVRFETQKSEQPIHE